MEIPTAVPYAALGLVVVWLASLSYFLYRSIKHYNALVKNTNRGSLTTALDSLLSELDTAKKEILHITTRLSHQEHKTGFALQKIGLVRFNPSADTGGEQSFIISLLDDHNNGIVVTSLQGRSGNRWYAKQIKGGKGVSYDLSKEEEESLKKAKPFI